MGAESQKKATAVQYSRGRQLRRCSARMPGALERSSCLYIRPHALPASTPTWGLTTRHQCPHGPPSPSQLLHFNHCFGAVPLSRWPGHPSVWLCWPAGAAGGAESGAEVGAGPSRCARRLRWLLGTTWQPVPSALSPIPATLLRFQEPEGLLEVHIVEAVNLPRMDTFIGKVGAGGDVRFGWPVCLLWRRAFQVAGSPAVATCVSGGRYACSGDATPAQLCLPACW